MTQLIQDIPVGTIFTGTFAGERGLFKKFAHWPQTQDETCLVRIGPHSKELYRNTHLGNALWISTVTGSWHTRVIENYEIVEIEL